MSVRTARLYLQPPTLTAKQSKGSSGEKAFEESGVYTFCKPTNGKRQGRAVFRLGYVNSALSLSGRKV
jgi:hypothetical protein